VTTLSQKRQFKEVEAALEAHEAEEADGKESDGSDQESRSISKKQAAANKTKSIRDKRRKIKQRGEILEEKIQEVSAGLTDMLGKVVDGLVPALEAISRTNDGATGMDGAFEEDISERLESMEARQEATEQAITDLKTEFKEELKQGFI
jgi:tetrahydromethanopterin S-methyltransferase subunit G